MKFIRLILVMCLGLSTVLTGCGDKGTSGILGENVSAIDENDAVKAFSSLEINKDFMNVIKILSESEIDYINYMNGTFEVENNGCTLTVAPFNDIIFTSEGAKLSLSVLPVRIQYGTEVRNAVCWLDDVYVNILYIEEDILTSVPVVRFGSRYLGYPYKVSDSNESSFYIIDTKAEEDSFILSPNDIALLNGLDIPNQTNRFIEPVIEYPDNMLPMYLYTVSEDGTAKTSISYIVRYDNGNIKMEIDTPELDRKLGLIAE